MTKLTNISVLFFIIFATSFSTVNSIRCYNCISPMANDCRDTSQMSSTECDSSGSEFLQAQPVCLKIVKDIKGETYVTKMCALEGSLINPCSAYMQQAVDHCSTCKGDLCNSSSRFVTSFWIIGMMLILIMINLK